MATTRSDPELECDDKTQVPVHRLSPRRHGESFVLSLRVLVDFRLNPAEAGTLALALAGDGVHGATAGVREGGPGRPLLHLMAGLYVALENNIDVESIFEKAGLSSPMTPQFRRVNCRGSSSSKQRMRNPCTKSSNWWHSAVQDAKFFAGVAVD
ncbi:hypothetical protein OPV22_012279 [Ensete ventricosum]|uniref:Uncharacterized protein n=1 Tax=Ensete ventricosum TaxID=4639 RepID=A0AAV8R4J5_ENSVE|nr:hypothetical protein OPV22_012279 [Ensete ventricosum]